MSISKPKFWVQLISLILIFQCVGLPVWGQQIPRGVFLGDEERGGDDTESFRSQEPSPEDLGPNIPGPESLYPEMGGRSGSSSQILFYQVHVLGEVKRPGTFRVTPSMRVMDAIQLAGGLKRNGSERFVEIRKAGQSKGRILDLFAYKTFGNLSQNPYLEDNDAIYIPLKRRVIEIEGPVRRTGTFELKNEKSLLDIIKLAGGFTVGASQQDPIKVIRYSGSEEKKIFEISTQTEDMQQFEVMDGDVIVAPHKFLTKHEFDYNLKQLPNDNIFYPSYESRVFVIGAVRAPGAFKFNQYYNLRQYLTLAGGTTSMAKNKSIKVVSAEGEAFKAKNGNYNRIVNPGDTIIVPEKLVPASFYISLLPTIASLGLSAAALFR